MRIALPNAYIAKNARHGREPKELWLWVATLAAYAKQKVYVLWMWSTIALLLP